MLTENLQVESVLIAYVRTCKKPRSPGTTIIDKFIGTVQSFMFQITIYHILWVLLQPPPPHSMLLGGDKGKIGCQLKVDLFMPKIEWGEEGGGRHLKSKECALD